VVEKDLVETEAAVGDGGQSVDQSGAARLHDVEQIDRWLSGMGLRRCPQLLGQCRQVTAAQPLLEVLPRMADAVDDLGQGYALLQPARLEPQAGRLRRAVEQALV